MEKQAANPDELEQELWRKPDTSYSSLEVYEKHLIEQYKLAVEMADRVSARRMLANSFFVAVHTAIIAAISFLAKEGYFTFSYMSLVLFAAAFVLCVLWWAILDSYRKLNSGKFKVIGKIEERLPLAIYGAEWIALGQGKKWSLYTPLTHIEQWVPWAFFLTYAGLAIVVATKTANLPAVLH
jgi:hypothetical protein